jgi:hypothetical protein
MRRGQRFESARRLSFSWGFVGKRRAEGVFSEVQKKLQDQCSGLGQLIFSMEYDAVVRRPEICIERWDRYLPLSLM